jgi:hypothetical protein
MLDVYVKVNIELTQILEDSKDNPTQKKFVDHVSQVVEVPPLARYSFQKHKVSTQDENVPKNKKNVVSSLSNVNLSEITPNLTLFIFHLVCIHVFKCLTLRLFIQLHASWIHYLTLICRPFNLYTCI